MTNWSYKARIARAAELATKYPAAHDLLVFYGQLAELQERVASDLHSSGGTGVDSLLPRFPALIRIAHHSGTKVLADFAAENLETETAREQLLTTCWEGGEISEAGRFYARALLQPYAEHMASLTGVHAGHGKLELEAAKPQCPFCSSRPVAGVLRGEGEGAKRSLFCSLCSTEWPFRRVLCPNCGQEDKDHLPVYSAPEFAHVRVEACDICRTYIKSVDLTKDGHAVPIVDEIATVALNLWADENGYTKLELNLLGL